MKMIALSIQPGPKHPLTQPKDSATTGRLIVGSLELICGLSVQDTAGMHQIGTPLATPCLPTSLSTCPEITRLPAALSRIEAGSSTNAMKIDRNSAPGTASIAVTFASRGVLSWTLLGTISS